MSGRPKVSVCIPSHNAARFLPAAIESALAQELDAVEVIVSDDASTDDTAAVCASYSDPRLRIVRSEKRLGQSGNWNRCLELAAGEYVILLHADDALSPGYLRAAVPALDENKDAGLVHCTVRHIDEAGHPLLLQRLFDSDRIDGENEILRRLLLDGCVINPAGVLVRREALEHTGPFTDRIVWGVDWHMWIRIALQGPVAYLAAPLALYREHTESGTSAVMKSGRNARDELWALEDVFALIERTRPELSVLKQQAIYGVAHRTWCFAEAMCELGEMRAARAGIINAVRIQPGMLREAKVWALWAATFAGYRSFAAAHSAKQRLPIGHGPSSRTVKK